MSEEGKNYSEREVRRLKRCLLGFCGEKATKSPDELYKAIQKAEIAYWDSSIKETMERLVDLSPSDNLVYKVSGENLFLESDSMIDHTLHINKNEDGSYKVFTSEHERIPTPDFDTPIY